MAYNTIATQGTATVTLAAGDSIAVQSLTEAQVFEVVGFPNYPTDTQLEGTVVNEETVFGPYASGATIIVEASASPVYYAVGTDPIVGNNGNWQPQGAPADIADGASMGFDAADLLGGIVTATPTTGRNIQLPTGAQIDAATEIGVNESFDWSLITLAAFALTITVDTGHTIVGAAATAGTAGAVARFRTRKTAADTFVTYRIG
jgi:hypothetical protein